ncbi:MAG: hypothetical protein NTV95_00590 [Candidatus Saccharibacteria bacterium]|nr:hypothetical protein [Candidatus Saccharibacteria bacterium]
MIDIQFIRDNPELVQQNSAKKGYEVDIEQLLGFDAKRRELLGVVEDLRMQRNQIADSMKGSRPSEEWWRTEHDDGRCSYWRRTGQRRD